MQKSAFLSDLSPALSILLRNKVIEKRNRRRKGISVAPTGERRTHPKCRCVLKQVPAPVSAWLFQIPGENLCSLLVGGVGWPHEALLLMPKSQCSHWSMIFYITPHKVVLIWNTWFWASFLQMCLIWAMLCGRETQELLVRIQAYPFIFSFFSNSCSWVISWGVLFCFLCFIL